MNARDEALYALLAIEIPKLLKNVLLPRALAPRKSGVKTWVHFPLYAQGTTTAQL